MKRIVEKQYENNVFLDVEHIENLNSESEKLSYLK
jgi:hypothetical protein